MYYHLVDIYAIFRMTAGTVILVLGRLYLFLGWGFCVSYREASDDKHKVYANRHSKAQTLFALSSPWYIFVHLA